VKTRLLLLAVLAVTGTLLAARGLLGPFNLALPMNSPMNVEGVFALSFLALLFTRETYGPVIGGPRWDLFLALPLAFLVIAAFAGTLDFPLLADDYIHIWNAHHADARMLWAHFAVPETDHFFRPAVYCSYALDAVWAGLSPTAWRAGNLAIHIINVLLVYRLCREMSFGSAGAFAGALIFGLHGSRPEAVTWIAARFDLMATLFGVACLFAVLRGARWWITAGLLTLALMSKESAYVVPLLAIIALRYSGLRWREIWKSVSPLLATAAVVLTYRVWLLNGIGGYRDPANGSAVVFHFGLASTLNALFVRFWATLMFPLNWTGGIDKSTAVFLAAAIVAMIYLAWRGTERRKLLAGVAIAFVCALPVHQFLAIGMDLEKSRVLYFASVGVAILFAGIFEKVDWKTLLCAVALIGFQWSALRNNLGHWKQVGELAGRTCAAQAMQPHTIAGGLPNVVDGVYFLKMGYPECLNFYGQTSETAARIRDAAIVTWDPKTRTLN
jgi:hypothetical protein